MTDLDNIADILLKRFSASLTAEEQQTLDNWLAQSANNRAFFEKIDDEDQLRQLILAYHTREREQSQGRVLLRVSKVLFPQQEHTPVSPSIAPAGARVHVLRRWAWVAASVLLLIIAGTYFWPKPNKNVPSQVVQVKDIPPGKEGAILTLADGSKIVLDSLHNGALATQNGTQVSLQDGRIVYDAPHSPLTTHHSLLNTMTTPKGRQFRLTLPDGTNVWLNAASSIRYPTAFTGAERRVTITGEAYFEVAKDKMKPFYVQTGSDEIRVLGTHFNVNAYEDEPAVKTTLLEGSVQVANHLLQPGQAYAGGKTTKANTGQDIAWKDGLFNFNDLGVETAMRQLARWYDIEIRYEGKPPTGEFIGKLGRNLSLAQALKILDGVVVRLRLEGKTLYVSPL